MQFVWVPSLRCWVSQYETTNGEYRKCDPRHDSREYETRSLNADRQPVVFVSSDDAAAFGKWLTRREREAGRLPDGFAFRLPSGDEWTTFARCGDKREFPWGSQWPPRCGNYADLAARSLLGVFIENYRDRCDVSCPVEASGSNAWGLCGVGGNVWEWTEESRGPLRLARGGAWDDYLEEFLKCSFRDELDASTRTFNVGFRLVLGPVARSSVD
jgi:formylglycine-generating enzyme required for sulfatase activity